MMISLTGFMGCGKSSVGRKLSALLSCPYADLDSIIEESQGRSVPEIFASDGEAGFRRLEYKLLDEYLSLPVSGVLSLGGGTVMSPECAGIVHTKTTCIYLRASVVLKARLRTVRCFHQHAMPENPHLEASAKESASCFHFVRTPTKKPPTSSLIQTESQ